VCSELDGSIVSPVNITYIYIYIKKSFNEMCYIRFERTNTKQTSTNHNHNMIMLTPAKQM